MKGNYNIFFCLIKIVFRSSIESMSLARQVPSDVLE